MADLDGDGDAEIAAVSSNDRKIAWYANPGTDPTRADTDGDGLGDAEELSSTGTDPGDADSDDDGASDAAEVAAGTDPLDPGRYPVVTDRATVLDPGHAADANGFGSVARLYGIGRHEVTVRDYVAFLNAVAASDPNGLYLAGAGQHYGIARSGSDGSYAYTAIAGRARTPVNFVSLYDAMRFANWLHNGQPEGAQDAATTEDGA